MRERPFVTVCMYCLRTKISGRWVEARPVPWARVSHGVCGDHLRAYRARLERIEAREFSRLMRSATATMLGREVRA